MTGEQRVFPVQSNRSDQILDLVGVDLDAPVGQEGLQSVPVAVDVGQLLAEARFGRDAQALRLQPAAEGFDQRGGSCLAGREALARGRAANATVDREAERSGMGADSLQRRGDPLRYAGVA